MSYRPHQAFVSPARARSEPWRLIVGYVLIMLAELGLVYAAFAIVARVIGQDLAFSAFQGVFQKTVTSRDTLLLLFSFVFLAAATVVITVQLHRRPPATLVGPPMRALRDFVTCLRVLAPLWIVVWFTTPGRDELLINLDTGQWLLLLPLALPALLIQTGAEEMLFRGYLQQQIAARFASPVFWMGIPAAMFAWAHYEPETMGSNALVIALWAGVFSLAASDLTARTGTLGAAIALHFTNNAIAILVASYPGQGSGLALFLYPETLITPLGAAETATEFAVIGVMWLGARLALRV